MLWKGREEFISYWWRLSELTVHFTFSWILFYCCKRNLFFKWSLTHQSPSGVLTFRGRRPFHLATLFGPHILLEEKMLLFPLAFSYLKECTHKAPLAKLSLILTWLYFLSSLNVTVSIQSNKIFWEEKTLLKIPQCLVRHFAKSASILHAELLLFF